MSQKENTQSSSEGQTKADRKTARRKREQKPDPNNYRQAKTDEDKGFIRNPVAGGAIPSSQFPETVVNGKKG